MACLLFICLQSHGATAQQETLFSDLNANNPVPSPDGKLVAFVRTGRARGSGGNGRSSLISKVEFATPDGKSIGRGRIDAFLGEWLPDGSAVVCFRDRSFGLVSTDGWDQKAGMHSITARVHGSYMAAERITYSRSMNRFVWLERTASKTLLQTPRGPIGDIGSGLPPSDLIVPSPDGRYLAVIGTIPGNGFHLWVFDTQESTWADLGEVTVHPSPDRDYIKPSWNPWLSDSSRLV